jgi:ATP-dependent RNA circularization protein (DNA/RNA ligase family)
MNSFFRFPHTPHLAWLGDGIPRGDKVFSPSEAHALLASDVIVEEKVDGANIGLSLSTDGTLLAQNRGQYLTGTHTGQFARLPAWLSLHSNNLLTVLLPNLILFGEWCAARHSLEYDALPDWFLLFDVYDRNAGRFWNSAKRNALAEKAGLATVREILRGHTSLSELKQVIANISSQFRNGPLEGVVVRRESGEWCEARAKLVRPDFTQCIATHWRKRIIEWNRIGNSHQHDSSE